MFCFLFSFFCPKSIFAENQHTTLKPGNYFPNISLPVQFHTNDKAYLGLALKKSYALNNIQAEFILIEFFSIYCPVCQKHAEQFNHLHRLIEKDNLISRNTKMIGIGTGNNSKEVEYFKQYFNITFPCIADPDFRIHKALHEPRTPLLILVQKQSVPYTVLSVLDFTKTPENLINEIRDEIHRTQSVILKQKQSF